MRVLMTADAVGGVWTYCLALARSLRPLGVEVELAVMGPAPSAEQVRDAQDLEVHVSSFPLEWMEDPWTGVARAGAWLLDLESARRPDLIHVNGYAHAALDFQAPCIAVAHSCVSSWWRAVHGTAAPTQWDTYRRRVAEGLDGADHVVAVSRAMSEALHQEYGRLADSIIYNGLAPYEPKPDIVRQPAVFCAGRFWDAAKNLQLVASAARQIDAEIFAAGDGWVSGEVWALGRLGIEDLRNWYSRCAVFCHPALYEPFGLAPLEAALHGCALVLGDIPSLREIWGDCAVFADARDPANLARCVNSLLSDNTRRFHFARIARERALHFSADRQAGAYKDRYESVREWSGKQRAHIGA